MTLVMHHEVKRSGAKLMFRDTEAKLVSDPIETRNAPTARMVESEFRFSLDSTSPDYAPNATLQERIEFSFRRADIAIHAQAARRFGSAFALPESIR